MKKLFLLLVVVFAFTGCVATDAEVASKNLSNDADMFKVDRRIVFYNGINGEYMLTITGKCSIEPNSKTLRVTCKVGEHAYKKHYLGLSDNVTYFVEHLEPSAVSAYHYKVIFKPQAILPDVDFSGSLSYKELPR